MSKFVEWIDKRIPMSDVWEKHFSKYYAPKNFNFWYYFGSLLVVVLVIQLITGIFLTMNYKPDAAKAFASVEFIMRDVSWGWLIRYLHSTGASFFFLFVYLHMFRGIIYGSYRKPRELLWLLGVVLFFLLLAEAFMGYLLPWGQMSYWGAQVIISLFSAVPFVGEGLSEWIRGDYVISDVTLNRFFALHVIALPLLLVVVVYLHIVALHHVGSNNPDGIEIKENKNDKGVPVDGIPFHPYYTIKDMPGIVLFLVVFCGVVFYAPEFFGLFLEKDNFAPADPLKTPEHIVPVWYMTPFYSILRAIPDKLMGVMAMGGAIFMLALLPWLDRSPVKSIRYKGPIFKFMLFIFVASFIILGYLGMQPVSPLYTWMARVCSLIYFAFFLAMPWYSKIDSFKTPPLRLR